MTKPIFSIEIHKSDLILLEKIKLFFGVGNIVNRKNRSTVIYSVQSIKDINEDFVWLFI